MRVTSGETKSHLSKCQTCCGNRCNLDIELSDETPLTQLGGNFKIRKMAKFEGHIFENTKCKPAGLMKTILVTLARGSALCCRPWLAKE